MEPLILNQPILDDFTKKTLEFGKSMLVDILRIDELVNSADIVSELEIVMFSRRMTSRCSELSLFNSSSSSSSNGKSTYTADSSLATENEIDSFGIIVPHTLTEKIKFELVKIIISNISHVISTIKSYNIVVHKGLSTNELIPYQNGYYQSRKNILQSWNSLILFISKASWKLPKFILFNSNSNSTTTTTTTSTKLQNNDLIPLPSAPITISKSTTPTPTPSPVVSPSKPPLPTSPQSLKSTTLSPPPTSTQKQQQDQILISNPTLLDLFEVIFQLNVVSMNLLWHLKNHQRILKNKKQQNNNNCSTTTTPLTSPSSSPDHNNNNNNTPTTTTTTTTNTTPLPTTSLSPLLYESLSPPLSPNEKQQQQQPLLSPQQQQNLLVSNGNNNHNNNNRPKDVPLKSTTTTTSSNNQSSKSKQQQQQQQFNSKPPHSTTPTSKYDKNSSIKTIFFNSKLNNFKKNLDKEFNDSRDTSSSTTTTTTNINNNDIENHLINPVASTIIENNINNNQEEEINHNNNNNSIIDKEISIKEEEALVEISTQQQSNTNYNNTEEESTTSSSSSFNESLQMPITIQTTKLTQIKIPDLDISKLPLPNENSGVSPKDDTNNSNNVDNHSSTTTTPSISSTSSTPSSTSAITISPRGTENKPPSINTTPSGSPQHNNIVIPSSTTTTTSSSSNNNKEINNISSEEDSATTTTPTKKKNKDKKKNNNLLTLSRHIRALKQAEDKQRNSFNQFWLEGSTHNERQDKIPTDDKQRQKLTSLGSYVSNLVIRGLLASATPVDPPHIETYNACVLFADISGFTALTERLGTHGKEGVELLTQNLNRYFEILIKIVKRYGGDIVKFAGDAVLAHWPTNGEILNRVRIACECAIALQKQLHNFPVPGGFLTLHIGVGCGAIAGLYVGGASGKVEFLIAGEALIEATLCEKEADPGETYISPQTQEKMKPYASFSQKKGKTNYKLESINVHLDKNSKYSDMEDSLMAIDRNRFLQELPLLMDMEDSLKRFVPNAVINQLKSHDHLAAELRFITVMFVNLSYGIPDPVKDLNKLQSIVYELQTIVYKYEGTVRQFIIDDKGCILIAAWGVPPWSHEDDPSRAVEAAMEVVVNLFKLKVISTIGVTTGKCFCGDVGSDERREYAVVGDIVNLSARLMSHSQGGVLCDEETSKTAKHIEFVKLSNPIKVKGKTNLINVYKPMKKHSSLKNSSPRHLIKNKGMIGRHAQLRQMANIIDCLRMGHPTHVVILEAEAGLGKTRFISEIKYSFCIGIKILKGNGIQMNESISFYIWKQILSGFLKDESANQFKSFSDLGPHVTLLNPILDLKLTVPDTNRRYSAPQRSETQQMLMLRLVQKAIPPGTIIVIDDAHFMDSASWTLTFNLCKQLENVLVIISMRPSKEGLPYGFSQLGTSLTKIQLEPLLSKEETHLLVEQMLDIKTDYRIPEEIVEEIHNRSQGNHFVIEEMVNGLKSNGLIDENTSEFHSKLEAIEHVRLSLPRTVTSLITSRVDRLTPTQQLELKVSSVIGMPFTVDSLFKLLPTDTISKEELANDLMILERLDFIKSRVNNATPELLYSFHHTRTQEVIYELMLFSQRRELHHKIARILELTCTPQNSLYISLVHHYYLAQDYCKTIEYSTKAGAVALAENNNKEAVKFFQLALKCHEHESSVQAAQEDDYRIKKIHRRSTSINLIQSNNTKESVSSLSASVNANNNANSKEMTGNSLSTLSMVPYHSNSNPRKVPLEVISITRKLGLALFNMGLLQSASIHLLSALKQLNIELPPIQSSSSGSKPKLSNRLAKAPRQDSLTKFLTASLDPLEKREATLCLVLLSKIAFHDCSRSQSSWCSFVSLQLSHDNWNLQSEAYSIGIRVLGTNGDSSTPLKYYAEILARSDETNGYVYGNSHQAWGIYMSGLGRWVEAESGYQKSTEAASKMGDKKLMEESSIFLANCLSLTGQLKASMTLTMKTLESSRDRGDPQMQICALLSQGFNSFHSRDYSYCQSVIADLDHSVNSLGISEITNSSQVNYYTLKAQLFLLKSEWNQTYDYCKKVYNILSKCESNNFTTYESYASLPLILIKLLQNYTLLTPQPQKAKLVGEINESITFLERYAETFPIGQPRLLLVKGIMSIIANKEFSESEVLLKESKEKSLKYGMAIEEALCTHYTNVYLSTGNQSQPSSPSLSHHHPHHNSNPSTPSSPPASNNQDDSSTATSPVQIPTPSSNTPSNQTTPNLTPVITSIRSSPPSAISDTIVIETNSLPSLSLDLFTDPNQSKEPKEKDKEGKTLFKKAILGIMASKKIEK
eukprot:gene2067-2553_t